MKKKILIILAASITMVMCLTGCLNTKAEKAELGERYDSDKILVREEITSFDKDCFAEVFNKYSIAISETEVVVHENTAIAVASHAG